VWNDFGGEGQSLRGESRIVIKCDTKVNLVVAVLGFAGGESREGVKVIETHDVVWRRMLGTRQRVKHVGTWTAVSLSVLRSAEETLGVFNTCKLVCSSALGVDMLEGGRRGVRKDGVVAGSVYVYHNSNEHCNHGIELGVVHKLADKDDLMSTNFERVGCLHSKRSGDFVESQTTVASVQVVLPRATVHLVHGVSEVIEREHRVRLPIFNGEVDHHSRRLIKANSSAEFPSDGHRSEDLRICADYGMRIQGAKDL